MAGHRGMVGAAIVRRLSQIDCEVITASRVELDLLDQSAVADWMHETAPEAVFMAAARVGGIGANQSRPVDFLHQNIVMATNVISTSYEVGVEKLLFLGSSCIYPKYAPQPIREDTLLTGPLEPTNEWYAIAKIAGIKLCQAYRKQFGADFISAQPTNLYGPGDNYDLADSHVLPALLRKFHEARMSGAPSVVVWGSGSPLREFLYVDDLADALVFLLQHYSGMVPVNVGSGEEVSIRQLAELIGDVVGSSADLVFDRSKPDGTPRKLLSSEFLHSLGWDSARPLREGLRSTYAAFLEECNHS